MIAARSRGLKRVTGVALAAVLMLGGLSACKSNSGTAAYVGSTRISESTVVTYVGRDAKVTTSVNQNTGATEINNPKSDVLATLIVTALVDQMFRTVSGDHPTDSELDNARQAFLQQNFGTIGALEAAAEAAGYSKAYAGLYVDENAKITVLSSVLNDPGDGSVIGALSEKLNIKVTVNPRYGDWDPKTLTLSSGPFTPSYLKASADDANAGG